MSSGGSGGSPSGGSAPPQITAEPADQDVQSGQSASFVTVASGTVDSVQWQVSTDGGGDWSNVPFATATSYSFVAALSENGYRYRAVLSNSAGSTTTRAAVLTVTVPPSATAPVVTMPPANQTVGSRDYATFTPAASGNPTPVVQWEVSGNARQSWSPILNAIAASYTFKGAAGQDGYEYRARSTNAAGTVTTNAVALVVAEQSENWAGYAALGQQFSAVTGSWTVPTVTCPGQRHRLLIAVDRDRRLRGQHGRAGRNEVRLPGRRSEVWRLV